MDLTSEVDSCSDKSVSSGGLYPPWVSITALASLEAARPTLGGYRPPLETLLPEAKKTSSVKSVSHVGKDHFIFFASLSVTLKQRHLKCVRKILTSTTTHALRRTHYET